MKTCKAAKRFLSLILVTVLTCSSAFVYASDLIPNETEAGAGQFSDYESSDNPADPADEYVRDDLSDSGKDEELDRLIEEAKADAESDDAARLQRLEEEAPEDMPFDETVQEERPNGINDSWNIPVFADGLSEDALIRARMLDTTDESDSSLIVYFQDNSDTYGILGVYEVELTQGTVQSSEGVSISMIGVDVLDPDRVALLSFDMQGNCCELPYSYNADISAITFVMESLSSASNAFLATALKPAKDMLSEEENVFPVEEELQSDPEYTEEGIITVETEKNEDNENPDDTVALPGKECTEENEFTAEAEIHTETEIIAESEPSDPDTEIMTERETINQNGAPRKSLSGQDENLTYKAESAETESDAESDGQMPEIKKDDQEESDRMVKKDTGICSENEKPDDQKPVNKESEDETETEAETEAPVLRLRSAPHRSQPWQDDFTYETGTATFPGSGSDIPYIKLQKYIGSDTEVSVPCEAIIDGVSYLTWIGQGLFRSNTTITSVSIEDGVYCDDFKDLFYRCTSLTDVDLQADLSHVTSMYSMFEQCYSLHSINLSGWDTRSVVNYSSMFAYSGIEQIELGKLNFSNARNVDNMFYSCSHLERVDLTGIDTSHIVSMYYMFSNCSSLTDIDFSAFSFEKTTDISSMFANTAIKAADITSWNTESIKSADSLFYNCRSLKTANLEGLDFSSTKRLSSMFRGCSELETVNLNNVLLGSNVSLSGMFSSCSKITSIDFGSIGLNGVSTGGYFEMFYGCSSLEYLDLSSIDMRNQSGVTTYLDLFGGTYYPHLDTIIIGENYWIDGIDYSYISFPGDRWVNTDTGDTYLTKDMKTTVVSGFDPGTYTRADVCFLLYDSGDAVLQSGQDPDPERGNIVAILTNTGIESKPASTYTYGISAPWNNYATDITRFIIKDPVSVLTLESWFSGMTNLESIEGLEKIDTSKAGSLNGMFRNTTSLKEVDLSTFDTGNVKNITDMFSNSGVHKITGFETLNFNALKTKSYPYANNIFYRTANIHSLNLSSLSGINCIPALSNSPALCHITIPEGFDFNETITGGELFNQEWIRLDTGETFTSQDLFATYDGTEGTPAATYSRAIDISFHANGGKTDTAKKSGSFGLPIGELPSATRKGYVFEGWFTQKKGGTEIDTESIIDRDTYYAHWIPITYTLRLNANGAEQESFEVELSYPESYTLPAGFTRSGYHLTGWNTRSNGRGANYPAGDAVQRLTDESGKVITLYAEWEPVGNTIIFDSHGGSEIPEMNLQPGSKIGILYTPFMEGYAFLGWFTEETSGDQIDENTIPAGNTTYHAHWAKNPVITYISTGDTIVCRETIPYNHELGALPTASNSRYTFLGWFTEREGGDRVYRYTTVDSDKTYYAHWGYMLHFDPTGGTITEQAESDGTVVPDAEASDYEITSVAVAIKDGYVFDGWFTDRTGGNKVEAGARINLTECSVLYAHWTPDAVVTLTYVLNGGNLPSDASAPVKYYTGQTLAPMHVPTRSGYLFDGWYDAPESGNAIDGSTVITEDMTVYAYWTKSNRHRLEFDSKGGSSTRYPYYVEHGKTLQVLPGSIKSGYILDGWFTQTEGGEKLTTCTPITANATYYAHWIPAKTDETSGELTYSYSASWGNSSDSNVDNDGSTIIFHPTSRARQTAMLKVFFELNQAVDTTLPEGSVRITVPKKAFKNWDGEWTGTDNMSSNLPQYPNIRSGMLFSYIDEGDHYTLINNQELSGGAGVNVTISYSVDPEKVPGGAQNDAGEYLEGYEFYQNTIPVSFSIDKNLDNTPEAIKEKDLDIEMHTSVNTTHSKYHSGVIYNWDNSWGTKPADDGDSFYVIWNLIHDYAYRKTVSSQDLVSWEWSEDTHHDGTVVFQKSDYVITKHPLSALENAGADGLTLSNEAVLTETWKSGYQEKFRHSATIVVQGKEFPSEGSFDKTRSNHSIELSGGQDTIMEDRKSIRMPYTIVYHGGPRDVPLWDESTGTYSAGKRMIEIEDGAMGDIMYSSGSADNRYAWNPDTGNVVLGDSDYSFANINIQLDEYDAVKNGNTWSSPFRHNYQDYPPFEVWIRKKGEENYHLLQSSVSVDATVTFPEDTAGFKIRHESDYYLTNIQLNVYLEIKPTANVINLIQEDAFTKATSIIKNVSRCSVTDMDGLTYFTATNRGTGNSSAYDNEYELTPRKVELRVSKSADAADHVVLDAAKGTQDNTVTITAFNYSYYSGIKRFTSGIFYDLLPLGTMVNEATIDGTWNGLDENSNSINGTLPPSSYDVSFTNDWEHSGRTMMIIKVSVSESLRANKLSFRYKLRNTYENVVENGTTVENDLAFVNTSAKRSTYYSIRGAQSAITNAWLFDSIDSQYAGYVGYAAADINYVPVDAYSWGYSSMVKTASSYEFIDETLPNNDYTYRLTYSQSEFGKSDRIVFFNVLENGTPSNPSEWQGQFKHVNVKSIQEALSNGNTTVTCDPVVYYSTKERDSFTESDFDVSNTDVWTLTCPEDTGAVTAVAIDCSTASDGSPFILAGQQSLSAYITMTAPADTDCIGKSTTNPTVCYARKASGGVLEGESTPEYSDSTVTIREMDLELHKTSDPESGTQQAPVRVENESDIAYTISVANSDPCLTVHNIIIEDTIPEYLDAEWEHAVVYSEGQTEKVAIEASPRISLTHDGRKAVMVISEIRHGETLFIKIPSVVNMNGRNEAIDLINTAVITGANGLEKNITSETTYHRTIKPFPTYTFRKQWNELEPKGDILLKIDGTTDLGENGEAALKANQTFVIHASGGTGDDTDLTLTADADGVIHVPGTYGSAAGGRYTVFTFSAESGNKRYDFRYETQVESPEKPDCITIIPSNRGKDSNDNPVDEIILDGSEGYTASAAFPGMATTFSETPVSGWTLKEPDGIQVEPDGDDYLVTITNEAQKILTTASSVETVELKEDLEISKHWKGGKSTIAFDIHDSEGKTSKVSSIVILDGETVMETLDGANGAIISNQSYDVEKSYTAIVTFEDGTEKTVTINPKPFEKPDITVRVTTNGESQDIVLKESEDWKKTVSVFLSGFSLEEITTGDWEPSVEGSVVTNTINREIPITVVNTTTHKITPQTGNNPQIPVMGFTAIAISLTGILALLFLIYRKRIQKGKNHLKV